MDRTRSLFALALAACGPQVPVDTMGGTGTSGADTGIVSITTGGAADDAEGDEFQDESTIFDDGFGGDPPPTGRCNDEDPCLIDILVVIDNSGTMADAQLALVRSLVPLVRALEQDDESVVPVDVQMMFTTTDMSNILCEQFQQSWYTPAMGAPTTTGCNERIANFTGLGDSPNNREDICTSMCPTDAVPGDPFVAFYRDEYANVPDVPFVDVDHDGVDDSPAAQAVACLAPQGINGCGYEAPLEAMLRALDPNAEWNSGERPFLRPGSTLMIVIVTDEADCSLDDASVMTDPTYMEVRPGSGNPEPSSAICWNAGMACSGPDGAGLYSDCVVTDEPLLPVSRYEDLLVGQMTELGGHDVTMIALTGVPPVTDHNSVPPFEPVAGGFADLVIRDWRDGLFPAGDIFSEEFDDGVDAADLRFDFRVGPGCAVDEDGTPPVRALPNPRVHEVCQALDLQTDTGTDVRCCIESACDATMGLNCIEGWLRPDGLFGPGG